MNRFAELLDRLAYEPGRNNKLRLLTAYLRDTPDPDRGYALAAMTGALSFKHAKPGLIRDLITERTDPVLFGLSYDYVGDLSETVALMWPKAPLPGHNNPPPPTLSEVVDDARDARQDRAASTARALARRARRDRPLGAAETRHRRDAHRRLGAAGENRRGRARRQGPARDRAALAGTGAALSRAVRLAGRPRRQARQQRSRAVPARSCWRMRSRRRISPRLDPADFIAEWKWDGIRVQAVGGPRRARQHRRRGSIRAPARTSPKAFPTWSPSLHLPGAIDGELLVLREGRVQTFNVLQQRLNRKIVTPKLIEEFPAHLRAYDLLGDGDEDLRELPFAERRAQLETFIAQLDDPRIDLSPLDRLRELGGADGGARRSRKRRRRRRCRGRRRRDAEAPRRALPAGPAEGPVVEMEARPAHHRRRADVCPARPRQALVLLFRLHLRRLDARATDGDELVPVGKAYFGFTDEELLQIDRFVRRNTIDRFGPVREVAHEPDQGLVLEVAFEGLQRSTRHKSGVAMRFPRISRLRWDKPPREADRLETLERMLKDVTAN